MNLNQFDGNFDEAQIWFEKWTALTGPNDILSCVLQVLQEQFDVAETSVQQIELPTWRLLCETLLETGRGNEKEADTLLAEYLRQFADQDEHFFRIAALYSYRGEYDIAFEWIDRFFQRQTVDNRLIREMWNPFFIPLRQDARWAAVRSKFGFSDPLAN